MAPILWNASIQSILRQNLNISDLIYHWFSMITLHSWWNFNKCCDKRLKTNGNGPISTTCRVKIENEKMLHVQRAHINVGSCDEFHEFGEILLHWFLQVHQLFVGRLTLKNAMTRITQWISKCIFSLLLLCILSYYFFVQFYLLYTKIILFGCRHAKIARLDTPNV